MSHDSQQPEARFQENQERYRRIVEATKEGIWEVDANGNTNFVNRRMAQMLGFSVEAMLGMSIFSFMGEAWQAIAPAKVERWRQGITEQHDLPLRRQDGSEIWVLLSINPFFDADGQYAGMLAMVTDISDRQQTDLALQHSEARWRSLVENLPFGCWVCDRNNQYIFQNKIDIELWGNLVGRSPTELDLPSDFLERQQHNHRQALTNEVVSSEQQCWVNNESRTFLNIIAPIFAGDTINIANLNRA